MAQVSGVWVTEFGPIFLPDDFPAAELTKSGWFDRRRRLAAKLEKYIDEQKAKLAEHWYLKRSGLPPAHAPSFAEWLKS